MSKDQALGVIILLGSLAGTVLYFWLVFLSPWVSLTIQVSAFVAVAIVFAVLGWIGYTLASTPSPMPMEELELKNEVVEPAKE